MKGVVSILDGGLGNQMFQYAAALSVSERLGAPLALDLRKLGKAGSRSFALDVFRLKEGVGLISEGEAPKPPRRRYQLLRSLLGIRDYHKEKGFPYEPRIRSVSVPVTLDGYFQSERYFADVAKTIRADFAPRDELRDEIDALAARLLPSGPCVSLHVRRGDYTHPATKAVHGLLDTDYYERALRLMAEQTKTALPVCVFTDDPAWVRSHLALRAETRFISEHTRTALQDLILMSRCSHHITANSSFSWWGSWLNPSRDKIVVTPREWFRPESGLDTRDLRPAGWLQA